MELLSIHADRVPVLVHPQVSDPGGDSVPQRQWQTAECMWCFALMNGGYITVLFSSAVVAAHSVCVS